MVGKASRDGRLHGARILVTGGAGFIGSHLVRRFLAEGASVAVVDDFSTGSRDNLLGLPVAIYEADVRDGRALLNIARDCSHVSHQAALVEVARSMAHPATTHEINVLGAARVLAAARAAGVRRVVLASSCAVYGDAGEEPTPEARSPAPLSPYGASKAAAELVASGDARAFGQDCVSLRYFNVHGPRQRAEGGYAAAVPAFTRALLSGKRPVVFGDGKQVRDFTFVEDVVEANVLALTTATPLRGEAFNVASGKPVTVLELLAAIQDAVGSSRQAPEFAPTRAGDIRASRADASLAAQRLGFRARTSLADGVRAYVAWVREQASAS